MRLSMVLSTAIGDQIDASVAKPRDLPVLG